MVSFSFTSKKKALKFYKELRYRLILSKIEDKTVSVLVKGCKIDAEKIANRLYGIIKNEK